MGQTGRREGWEGTAGGDQTGAERCPFQHSAPMLRTCQTIPLIPWPSGGVGSRQSLPLLLRLSNRESGGVCQEG